MRLFRIFLMAVILLTILAGMLPSASYAYPNTGRVKVIVPMKPQDLSDIDAYDCWTAALIPVKPIIIKGKNDVIYPAEVDNPPGSNSCTLTFEEVYVRSDGYFGLEYNYTINNKMYTVSTFVYIARPAGRTYTASPVYMPAH